MAPPRDLSWTTSDGLLLHADDYPGGGGLPVICLHGLTRNARDFADLASWLAGLGRRVIAADMRGRGRSARDARANYRLPVYADDVARLLAQERIGRALFVGTSMGGLVTMELAASRPQLIAGAVVNDVGPVLGEAGLTRIAAYVGKRVETRTWADAAAHVERQNALAFPRYGAPEWAAMARRLFREEGGRIAPDYDPAIAHPSPGPARSGEAWAQWAALVAAAPVLLLRGALSDLLEPAVAARMAVPGVTLVEVPGVGHAPMLDEPAARAAIARFVAQAR